MARPAPRPALSKVSRKEHPLAPDTAAATQADPATRTNTKVPEDYTRLSTVLPASLLKAVKVPAVTDDRSIQDIVAEALTDWLAK